MIFKKVFALSVIIASFSTMSFAQDVVVAAGKKVTMDYTLTVNNEEIETSVGKKPLEIVIGSRMIIPGLEKGIEGMRVGEEKIINVAPKDGYGEVDPKAFKEFPKSSMPANAEPKAGMVLQATAPDGESFPAVISEVKGDKVILNFNHPMAGKTLTFKVKVIKIEDAPAPAAAAQPAPATATPATPAAAPAATPAKK